MSKQKGRLEKNKGNIPIGRREVGRQRNKKEEAWPEVHCRPGDIVALYLSRMVHARPIRRGEEGLKLTRYGVGKIHTKRKFQNELDRNYPIGPPKRITAKNTSLPTKEENDIRGI